MIIFTFLLSGLFAVSPPVHAADCGYAQHKSSIRDTEDLIIISANLQIPTTITEMPKKWGTKECVRLEFNISSSGRAKNISIRESSRSFDMNVAALDALKKYRFRYLKAKKNIKFTLVFKDTINIAPPYPDRKNGGS